MASSYVASLPVACVTAPLTLVKDVCVVSVILRVFIFMGWSVVCHLLYFTIVYYTLSLFTIVYQLVVTIK